MLASLQAWFPSIPLNIPNLRAATAGNKQFAWDRRLEEEYEAVKEILSTQIRLSPYNDKKELNLVIDGASSVGVGYVLLQFLDDNNPNK